MAADGLGRVVTGGSATTSGPLAIIDEITLDEVDVDGWLGRWRSEYALGAGERGLELVAVRTGGTDDPRHRTVMIEWRVRSVGTFWASRQAATADPRVATFWSATDAIALRRDRRVLRPVEP